MNILQEADSVIHGDRNRDYGHPLDNHTFTAKLYQLYIDELALRGKTISYREVCWLNILQKISRDMFRPKRDNLTDTAGYVGNIEMAEEEELLRQANN